VPVRKQVIDVANACSQNVHIAPSAFLYVFFVLVPFLEQTEVALPQTATRISWRCPEIFSEDFVA
jgi:hypothetical protein